MEEERICGEGKEEEVELKARGRGEKEETGLDQKRREDDDEGNLPYWFLQCKARDICHNDQDTGCCVLWPGKHPFPLSPSPPLSVGSGNSRSTRGRGWNSKENH